MTPPLGHDGRTCETCRYHYALAFECRFGPPQVVVVADKIVTAFPTRSPSDVACGEWTCMRTESQPSEARVLAELGEAQKTEQRAARWGR